MTYDMLGLINANETDSKTMSLTFEIPDNCNYVFTANNGICDIEIHLNPGEDNPSSNFVLITENVDISSNTFEAKFVQFEKSGIIKKPVIAANF